MKKIFSMLCTFLFLSCGDTQRECENFIRRKSTDEEFSGVIKDCFFQQSNGGRGAPTIVLNNGQKYYSATNALICYAATGDPIIKEKGSLKYIIKRQDTAVVFYPECGNIIVLDNGKTITNPMFSIDCGKRK